MTYRLSIGQPCRVKIRGCIDCGQQFPWLDGVVIALGHKTLVRIVSPDPIWHGAEVTRDQAEIAFNGSGFEQAAPAESVGAT